MVHRSGLKLFVAANIDGHFQGKTSLRGPKSSRNLDVYCYVYSYGMFLCASETFLWALSIRKGARQQNFNNFEQSSNISNFILTQLHPGYDRQDILSLSNFDRVIPRKRVLGTALDAGKPCIRFPMRSFFSISLILPATAWPRGGLNL